MSSAGKSEAATMVWIRVGVVAGLCTSVLYPVLLFAPLPTALTATLAALLGPSIGIASLGLMHLFEVRGRSPAAEIGALSNNLAGALFCAMALVQLAVRTSGPAGPELVGVWLGLDVAWDVYIGVGTLCFALAMIRHPRYRWPFAVPGLALGSLVLGLNLATFPTPPAEAGLFDIGPFVGLWYLAVTIQTWRSLRWAREELDTTSNPQ